MSTSVPHPGFTLPTGMIRTLQDVCKTLAPQLQSLAQAAKIAVEHQRQVSEIYAPIITSILRRHEGALRVFSPYRADTVETAATQVLPAPQVNVRVIPLTYRLSSSGEISLMTNAKNPPSHIFSKKCMRAKILFILHEQGKFVPTHFLTTLIGAKNPEVTRKTIGIMNGILQERLQLPRGQHFIEGSPHSGYRINRRFHIILTD